MPPSVLRCRYFSTSAVVSSRVGARLLRIPEHVTITMHDLLAADNNNNNNNNNNNSNSSYHLPLPARAKSLLTVSGPLGSLTIPVLDFVKIDIQQPASAITDQNQRMQSPQSESITTTTAQQSQQDSTLKVSVQNPKLKLQKSMWGTTRALVANMLDGVVDGFTVPIKLVGVGYRAMLESTNSKETAKGQRLSLKLGFSHPVNFDVPDGIDVRSVFFSFLSFFYNFWFIKVKVPAPQRILLQGIDKQKVTQFAANIRKWRPPEPYNQKGIFVGDETIKKKVTRKTNNNFFKCM